jgi:hypothetical protein
MSLKLKNNAGMTLTELLIYMVISSIGVILATQVWFDIFKSGVQAKGLLNISSEQGDVILYLEKDLMKMGNAWALDIDSNMTLYSRVMTNPFGTGGLTKDSSAFEEYERTNFDSLVIKGVLVDEGGFYAGYDSINWYVDTSNSTLRRSRVRFDSNATPVQVGNPLIEVIAEGVNFFKLNFGVHGADLEDGAKVLGQHTLNSSPNNTLDMTAVEDDGSAFYLLETNIISAHKMTDDSVKAGYTYELEVEIFVDLESSTWNVLDDTLQLRMVQSTDTDGSLTMKGSDAINMYPIDGTNTFNWTFSAAAGVAVVDYKPYVRFVRSGSNKVGTVAVKKITYKLLNEGKYKIVETFVAGSGTETDVYNKKNVKSIDVEIELTTGKSNGVSERTLRRVIPIPQHGEY